MQTRLTEDFPYLIYICCDAGIHAVKLEELERRLRNDLMHEAMHWGGRVLLHRQDEEP